MRKTTILRRRAALAAAIAVSALLAGCAAIPSSGPVEVGLTNLQQAEQFTHFNPSGPVAGSSQEDLVRGFVQAAASSANDYSVAREFLTKDYAAQWDPYYGVLIDDGARTYQASDESAGTLSLSAAAKLDSKGFMLPATPGPATAVRFEFELDNDEWRISSAPSGIILDSTTFNAIWAPQPLYYVGTGNLLVPETRWFLKRTALPTEVISGLIEGPSERMRDVLRSGFPAGTKLVTDTAQVVDGRARIDLSGEMLEANPKALGEVVQQIRTSLQNVTGVSGFDLLVEGSELRLPAGAESAPPHVVTEKFAAAGLTSEGFGILGTDEFAPIPGLSETIEGLGAQAIVLADDERTAVVRNKAGVQMVTEAEVLPLDQRHGLIDPVLDPFGWVWTVSRDAAGEMRVSADGAEAQPIATPWLADFAPVAMQISPDGSRLAVLVREGQYSAVLVVGVTRDANGMPTATSPDAETQMWVKGLPIDIDWVGQQRFAVLTRTDSAAKVTVGGPGLLPSDQGAVVDGIALSGGDSRTQLRVLTSEGELFVPQAGGWQRLDESVEVLAKRG